MEVSDRTELGNTARLVRLLVQYQKAIDGVLLNQIQRDNIFAP